MQRAGHGKYLTFGQQQLLHKAGQFWLCLEQERVKSAHEPARNQFLKSSTVHCDSKLNEDNFQLQEIVTNFFLVNIAIQPRSFIKVLLNPTCQAKLQQGTCLRTLQIVTQRGFVLTNLAQALTTKKTPTREQRGARRPLMQHFLLVQDASCCSSQVCKRISNRI